jgi:hypothetical protein
MIDDLHRRCGLFARFAFSVIAASAGLAVLFPALLSAQQDERSVRAAFVYNLTKYVLWPVSAHELNICVLGGGATGPALKLVVDGKISEGRTIHVLVEPSDASLRHCDILYWTEPVTSRARSILDKTRGTSTLTVGEDDRFVREGGMIGFVRTGDSIQLEVNLDSVKAGDLKISSRLLNLALIVHTEKRG